MRLSVAAFNQVENATEGVSLKAGLFSMIFPHHGTRVTFFQHLMASAGAAGPKPVNQKLRLHEKNPENSETNKAVSLESQRSKRL